jgi:hypothetical protein
MINEQVLSEKLKYLIMSEMSKRFEIFEFHVEFMYTDGMRDTLEEYDIDIKFDYQGTIDSESSSFGADIERMSETLRGIIMTYTITPEGKIKSGDTDTFSTFVDEGMIWGLEFEADTKHIFNMSFKVNYRENF